MNLTFGIVLTIVVLLALAHGSLVKTPKSVIAVVGGQVTLECETNHTDRGLDWLFTKAGTGRMTETEIYFKNEIVNTLSKYRVITTRSGQHNLQINSVELSHAGFYKCHDDRSRGDSAMAELVVLPSLPSFSIFYDELLGVPVKSEYKDDKNEHFETTENNGLIIKCNFTIDEHLMFTTEWTLATAIFPKNESGSLISPLRTRNSFIRIPKQTARSSLSIYFTLSISSKPMNGTKEAPSYQKWMIIDEIRKTTSLKYETTLTTTTARPSFGKTLTTGVTDAEVIKTTLQSETPPTTRNSLTIDITHSSTLIVNSSISEDFAPVLEESQELQKHVSMLYIMLACTGGLIVVVTVACVGVIVYRQRQASRTRSITVASDRDVNQLTLPPMRSEYLHSPGEQMVTSPAQPTHILLENIADIYYEIDPLSCKPIIIEKDIGLSKPPLTCKRPIERNNTVNSTTQTNCLYLSIIEDVTLCTSVPDVAYGNAPDAEYTAKRKKAMIQMVSEVKGKPKANLIEVQSLPKRQRSCPTFSS